MLLFHSSVYLFKSLFYLHEFICSLVFVAEQLISTISCFSFSLLHPITFDPTPFISISTTAPNPFSRRTIRLIVPPPTIQRATIKTPTTSKIMIAHAAAATPKTITKSKSVAGESRIVQGKYLSLSCVCV